MLDDGTLVINLNPDEGCLKSFSSVARSGQRGTVIKIELLVTDGFKAQYLIEQLQSCGRPPAKARSRS